MSTSNAQRKRQRARKDFPSRKYKKRPVAENDVLQHLKDRGLIISDQEQQTALHHLKTIGYYRLLIYMRRFQTGKAKSFGKDARFEHFIELYEFDRRLRLVTLDAVERLEVALRASISNAIALDSQSAHWFLDPVHFRTQNSYEEIKQKIEHDAGPSVEKGNKGVSLSHYYQTYKSPCLPPIWLVCEKMSLGSLSRLYGKLTTENQKKVARHIWNNIPFDLLGSWIRSLTDLRNMCAHQDRIWDNKLTSSPPKKHKRYPDDFM